MHENKNILKLARNVWRIKGMNPSPFMLDGTNTYLIGTGKSRLLIDTSNGNPHYTELLKKCQRIANFETIHTILLTHGHQDHSRVEPVQQLFPDAMIYKRLAEEPWIAIKDTATFQGEGYSLSAAPTPGHTFDHCSFRMGNVLFSGDAVIGKASIQFDDFSAFMESLEWIQDQKFHTIYPGKGPVIEDPLQRVQEIMDHRRNRTNQILAILKRKPSTLEELSIEIYRDYPAILRDKGRDLILLQLQHLIRVQSVRQHGIFYTIQ
jgi:glyoxylase-like metal-dependent hydrolase (beta-lactamase superfamily II)